MTLKSHILFTTTEGQHTTKRTMSVQAALDYVRRLGCNAIMVEGVYDGVQEASIYVEEPNPVQSALIYQLAVETGQDSVLFSDGYVNTLLFCQTHERWIGKGIKTTTTAPSSFAYTKLSNDVYLEHNLHCEAVTNTRGVL